jgi:hypothetical protein
VIIVSTSKAKKCTARQDQAAASAYAQYWVIGKNLRLTTRGDPKTGGAGATSAQVDLPADRRAHAALADLLDCVADLQ